VGKREGISLQQHQRRGKLSRAFNKGSALAGVLDIHENLREKGGSVACNKRKRERNIDHPEEKGVLRDHVGACFRCTITIPLGEKGRGKSDFGGKRSEKNRSPPCEESGPRTSPPQKKGRRDGFLGKGKKGNQHTMRRRKGEGSLISRYLRKTALALQRGGKRGKVSLPTSKKKVL